VHHFSDGGAPMPQPELDDPRSPKDLLMTRPDDTPLPTTLDPAGPESHGYPADPKRVPKQGTGDPDAKNPAPGDIDRSV
jgi:hypothetical protein